MSCIAWKLLAFNIVRLLPKFNIRSALVLTKSESRGYHLTRRRRPLFHSEGSQLSQLVSPFAEALNCALEILPALVLAL